jgi:hypothetical protein
MSSGKRSFFGTAAIVGSAALLLAWTAQEKPAVPPKPTPDVPAPSAPADELAQRVDKLEKLVAEQQLEIDRLSRVAAGIASGAQKLAAAVAQSKDHGFEQAGPNPAARTDLLNGMNGFVDAVKSATEPPKPAPAPEKK